MAGPRSKVVDEDMLVGEIIPRGFSFTDEFTNHWTANQAYGIGDAVRPSSAEGQTGYEYYVASSPNAGQSDGDQEPQWPTTIGATVKDGSVTWTCRALTNASLLERITLATWTAEDGLTVEPFVFISTPGRQEVSAQIGATEAFAKRRTAKCVVTTTQIDNTYVVKYQIKAAD